MKTEQIKKRLKRLEAGKCKMPLEYYFRERSILTYKLECAATRQTMYFKNERRKKNYNSITLISDNYVDY